jgi:16S rRNA C967 or C1407 C5-methylase (RsmB/RsmF family)
MIDRLESLIGRSEMAEFSIAVREWPRRCVRLHVDCSPNLPFASQGVPWSRSGFFVIDDVRPSGLLQFATADYFVQDAASLLPIELLDLAGNEVVCDLCGAPGGKASAISERLDDRGCLIANETIHSRVDVLRYTLSRTGRANYATTNLDPDRLAELCPQVFDAILLDVPCSGQALLGKSKQGESAFSEHQVEHCVARQRRILSAAVRMLKPGGRIIYSTCTFSIEENEAQIDWLCNQAPGAWQPIISKKLDQWQSPIAEGCYRLWPHRDECSGGFAAGLLLVGDLPISEEPITEESRNQSLRREGSNQRASRRRARNPTGGQEEVLRIMNKERKVLEETLASIGVADSCVAWRKGLPMIAGPILDEWLQLHPGLPCKLPPAILPWGKHLEPSHALAMLGPARFQCLNSIELSDADARRFVMGQALPRVGDGDGTGKEWVRATWHGRPLGWLKKTANRFNNLLPPWARMTGTS